MLPENLPTARTRRAEVGEIARYLWLAGTIPTRSGKAQRLNLYELPPSSQLFSSIQRYLPHLIVGLSISLLMVGAYAAVGSASRSSPKTLWSTNPLMIKVSANTGVSSTTDSFKCAPPFAGVVLKSSVSGLGASKMTITANPSGLTSCGPPFTTVTLTAHCIVLGASCKGIWSGTVTIFQGYSTIPPSLIVTIVVI